MKDSARKNESGFTLIEIVVAFGISALVLAILTRLLSTSLFTYNLQDQLSEMNQNARYTIKELGDILMQAGADLQLINLDSLDRDTIILPDNHEASCAGFTIKINPRGGIYEISQTISTAICTLKVFDARKFRHADYLSRVPGVRSTLGVKTYTIESVDTITNAVVFSPPDSFIQGDAICSFNYRRYFLSENNLCVDNTSSIIAENIDSLAIVFLDANGLSTSEWASMRSVDLLVRARTAQPDPKSDSYRSVTLTYKFRLRNKIES